MAGRLSVTAMIAGLLLATACQPPTMSACSRELRPGIVLSVRDSATGAPPADPADAVATIREGAYVDTLRPWRVVETAPEAGVQFAQTSTERAGTYTVRVEAPGYEAWERPGVRVTAGECHVRTVELEARLQR